MLLIEAAVVLILFALVVWATVRAVLSAASERRARSAGWRAATHARPEGGFEVVLECAGEPRQVVGELPPGLPYDEFSAQLAELQSAAEVQAAALNARRG